jgi:hypothetical protein
MHNQSTTVSPACRQCGTPLQGPHQKAFCSPSCSCAFRNPQGRKPRAERFWPFVDKTSSPDGCWLWLSSIGHNGYGKFSERDGGKLRQHVAHRVAWELTYGSLPAGKLLHARMPGGHPKHCVNPAHLYEGGAAENGTDARVDGVVRTKLTLEQVRTILVRAEAGEQMTALAREYGVSASTINHIVWRLSWRQLE